MLWQRIVKLTLKHRLFGRCPDGTQTQITNSGHIHVDAILAPAHAANPKQGLGGWHFPDVNLSVDAL